MSVQSLTIAQIQLMKADVEEHGLTAAIQIYSHLNTLGYAYAGWAKGVATGDYVTGEAALDYMQKKSFFGSLLSWWSDEASQTQVANIRLGMAKAYLATLESIASDNQGILNRDVRFDETREFHKNVFESNGLTINDWTLEIPMELIRRVNGEAKVEEIWQDMRSTSGDYGDALSSSAILWVTIELISRTTSNMEIKVLADEWLDRVTTISPFIKGTISWLITLAPLTDIVDVFSDRIIGTVGNDALDGGLGNDVIFGGQGADTLQGGFSNDLLFGGEANDVLNGDSGHDVLFGESGNDTLDVATCI